MPAPHNERASQHGSEHAGGEEPSRRGGDSRTGFTFPTENDFPDVPGNGKLPVFRFFPDFPIGKRFEIQISVFDIFRPDFGVFRPENVVGDRKL
jgi:hypothetical protein